MCFIDFIEHAMRKAPIWWHLVSILLAVASLLGWLEGKTPHFISDFWPWWFLLIVSLVFISVTWGAFKVYREEIGAAQAFRARITEKLRFLVKELSELSESGHNCLLAPGWGGTEHHWASKIASFQRSYWGLVADMKAYNKFSDTPISIDSHWALPDNLQVVTIPDLMDLLAKHKESISKI